MTKEMECVAGLDPSLTGFGIAVWPRDGECKTWRMASVPCPSDMDSRITRVTDLLTSVFAVLDVYRPGIVVVEHYAYGAIIDEAGLQRGHYDRIELGGILRADLITSDYIQRRYEVAPTTLKAFVFKGNAKKPEIVNRIWSHWKINCRTTDEADAAACAKMARCVAGFDQPEDDRQRTALSKMTKRNWESV